MPQEMKHADGTKTMSDWIKNTDLEDIFFNDIKMPYDLPRFYEFITTRVGGDYKALGISRANIRTVQHPDELARFLQFLHKHAVHIHTYLEIGISSGGTFFIVDSYLRACQRHEGSIHPLFSHGVDIKSKARWPEQYLEKYDGRVEFTFRSSGRFEVGIDYDLIFIDANHTYKGVKSDYEKFYTKCKKYIAFHDIVFGGEGCGVPQLWNEVKNNFGSHVEIIAPECPLGIGIGIRDQH